MGGSEGKRSKGGLLSVLTFYRLTSKIWIDTHSTHSSLHRATSHPAVFLAVPFASRLCNPSFFHPTRNMNFNENGPLHGFT